MEYMQKLKHFFAGSVHEIEFTKKDGTVRKMTCTRNADIISEFDQALYEKWMVPNPDKPRKESTTSLPVFDMEIKQFRSFSIDSLLTVDGMDAENFKKHVDSINVA